MNPAHFPDELPDLDGKTRIAPGLKRAVGGPAQAQRQHYLRVIQGQQPGQRHAFGGTPLRLGRKPVSDVVLADSEVSGLHCEVMAVGAQGDARVTDLQSTNGTFVNGVRVQGAMRLPVNALLQMGSQVLRHEFLLASEVHQAQELDRDLEKANAYVQSLLPAPLTAGPVLTDWFFLPSMRLGGDALGYHQLDARTFAVYLIDVSGHGAGAAMHSVSIMNVLRQRALPDTDFAQPAQVLARLNDLFQMETHGGMYFSIWYGVYDADTRCLRHASGGHHPAFLHEPGCAELKPLRTKNLVIGAMPELRYTAAEVQLAPGSRLFIFSDGVFEVVTRSGRQGELSDLLPVLQAQASTGAGAARRIYETVVQSARDGPLDDDFSMLVVTFV